jgi:2,5-diamino-6-(ribosylamino)-4(3H)-pyrimidinone 5'-phosphate reductase
MKVILHNSVSLDCSLTGFEIDIGLHYEIAGEYKADAHLIGSATALTGLQMSPMAEETQDDFHPPYRDPSLPLWVVIDSKGALSGKLHNFRRFEYCRDVLILISESTPASYRRYLEERKYLHHAVGKNKVDCRKALEILSKEYRVNTVLVDSGNTLGCHLQDEGLVDEISLLVHPVVIGEKGNGMFGRLKVPQNLKQGSCRVLARHMHITYKIQKGKCCGQ